jgi:hypothetical protein
MHKDISSLHVHFEFRAPTLQQHEARRNFMFGVQLEAARGAGAGMRARMSESMPQQRNAPSPLQRETNVAACNNTSIPRRLPSATHVKFAQQGITCWKVLW